MEQFTIPPGMKLVPDNVYGLPLEEVLAKYAPGRRMSRFGFPGKGDDFISTGITLGKPYVTHTELGWPEMDCIERDKRIILAPRKKKKVLVGEWEIADTTIATSTGWIEQLSAEIRVENKHLLNPPLPIYYDTFHIEEREEEE